MKWTEVEIETSEAAAEAVADLLLRLGAQGVATQDPGEIKRIIEDKDSLIFTDPGFLPSLPDFVQLRAWFPEADEDERDGPKVLLAPEQAGAASRSLSKTGFQALLQEALADLGRFLPLGRGLLALHSIQEKDWASNWKQYYHPIKISRKLVICPSWEHYDLQEEEQLIILDPGSAFGTGEHETTALCVRLMEELQPADGQQLLDLGTGSGILAIAAAKLGYSHIDALDVDPNAVKVAGENCRLNQVERQVFCYKGTLTEARQPCYDVIVANILSEVHHELLEEYAKRLTSRGYLILSGIIEHKAEALKGALASHFHLIQERSENDWVALLLQKK